MSAADDRDDDLELGSLRAMLRSMPDEEPPARGLDALMAAARDKAAQMADADKPEAEPWWQRMFAVFRRPPVLALASVTVLIGGALFLANRKDDMEAQPEVSVAEEAAPGSSNAPAPATSTLDPSAAPPAEAPVEPAARPEPEAAPSTPTTPPRRTPTGRRETISTKPRPKADRGAALGYGGDAFDGGGGSAVTTTSEEKASAPPAPQATTGTRRPEAATVQRESGAVPLSTLERLARQAERAAAKNDCVAVRHAMRQIAALDADKARALGTNPRIAACVGE